MAGVLVSRDSTWDLLSLYFVVPLQTLTQRGVVLSMPSKSPYYFSPELLKGELYPFVISTMKKIVPKEARAVSTVTLRQKLNGRSSSAIKEHSSAVFPP